MDMFGQLAQYGVLGIMLAIVGLVAVQQWRELTRSYETRITDNRQIVEVITTTNQTYAALSATLGERARATEAMANAQMAQVEILRRMESNHSDLVEVVRRAAADAQHVREEVERLSQEVRRLGDSR